MGLDMTWYAEPSPEEKTLALVSPEHAVGEQEIAYFRKFWDLNHFMGEFYPQGSEDFNCERLVMTWDIVEAMSIWAENYIPSGDWSQEHADELIGVTIPALRKALEEGRTVYYCPSW